MQAERLAAVVQRAVVAVGLVEADLLDVEPLLDRVPVRIEILLRKERGGVKPLKLLPHGVVLPIRSGNRENLEGPDLPRVRQMRASAQVDELALAVEAERGILLQIVVDVFDLVLLGQILDESAGLGGRPFKPLERLLWLALTETSLACANIHRNHPTITFDDHHTRQIDVYSELRRELLEIADDVGALTPEQIFRSDKSEVRLEDSCSPTSPLALASVTHVITSPPYPNRYSYVHQTRPQLHFMDVVTARRSATDIDLKTVGGTWGVATSMLMKTLIKPPDLVRPALSYWDALSRKSVLMCNYATKYFLDLERHLRSLRPMLASGARCAYVVGNSRLSGVEIYTETILARLFQLTGFEVEKIILFRKRGGRKRLYETAVVARV